MNDKENGGLHLKKKNDRPDGKIPNGSVTPDTVFIFNLRSVDFFWRKNVFTRISLLANMSS